MDVVVTVVVAVVNVVIVEVVFPTTVKMTVERYG